MFKSINSESVAEIMEKKSKFIATLCEANSKDEAEKILQETRKKYHDAKHNCYAYIVQKIEKCSDDGETSGTAGAPMLALLKSANLTNVIIIVTRYFGGILLGTGGLVRAYTESAQKAIENAQIVQKDYGIRYEVEIAYSDLKNIQFICKNLKINIVKMEYKENIKLILESTLDAKKELERANISLISINEICHKIITQN